MDDVSSFISAGFLNILEDNALNALRACGVSAKTIADHRSIYEVDKNAFTPFDTEHKHFKYFEQADLFVPSVGGTNRQGGSYRL